MIADTLTMQGLWWLHQNNVEAVWCWLPNFDQVCAGEHTVTALGNDAMAVNIIVNNETAALAQGHGGEQVQLAYLGKYLMQQRYIETAHHP